MIKRNWVRWYPRTYASKIILFVSLLIIAIIGVQTFSFIRTETTYLQNRLIEDKRSFTELLATNLGVAQTIAGFAFQSNLIKEAAETTDTVYVRFVKPNGEIYLSNIEEERGAIIRDPAINTDGTVVKGDTHKGERIEVAISPVSGGYTVWLGFSLQRVYAAVNQRVKDILLPSVTILITVNIIAYFIVRKMTYPIRELRKGVEVIGGGNLDYKVGVKSQDEIGELAEAFNKMADDLRKTTVSKDYVDNIIGSMLDALFVVDPNGKIRTVNEATCELLGYKEEELVGKPAGTIFIVGEETPFKVTKPDELIEQEELRNYETKCKTKDGRKIPILLSSSVMKDKAGKAFCIVCTAKDITERKRAEEALRAANKELREAQEKLVRSERLAAIGQLAGGVGHELRNPLGAIKNAAYYVRGRVAKSELAHKEPRVMEFLDIMGDEINSSNKIISDLLGFSRVGKPSVSPTQIKNVIEDALSHTTIPESIKLIKKLGAELPQIEIDASQIHQVLVNMITNAVQAMPEGGKLTIAAREKESFLEVEIADTGCGIPEEATGKIFDPLFTTKAKGVGLGLAVCKIIIDRHEGNIEVKSQAEKGTTFTIKLPLKRE